MAITGTGIPTNRSNIALPNDISQEILQKTQESSVVMRVARQIALPGRGAQIPVIAGDPEASWVSETDEKPVSNPTLDKKIMQAHKLAVIVPFSDEFRRDAAALYDALIARLPGVLAEKFDHTVLFGPTSGTLANFDNLAAVNPHALDVNTAYDGIVEADSEVSNAGGIVNGFILSPQGRGVLLASTDREGRPYFINSVSEGAVDRILGAPAYISRAAYNEDDSLATVGFVGDWTHALYGTVEGVQISYSSDATLTSGNTTINLFQRNMFAVRAEIEVGFVAETEYFARLTRYVKDDGTH